MKYRYLTVMFLFAVHATTSVQEGELLLETNKAAAKENFLKARKAFSTVFDKDHKVFEEIEKALKQTEK